MGEKVVAVVQPVSYDRAGENLARSDPEPAAAIVMSITRKYPDKSRNFGGVGKRP